MAKTDFMLSQPSRAEAALAVSEKNKTRSDSQYLRYLKLLIKSMIR